MKLRQLLPLVVISAGLVGCSQPDMNDLRGFIEEVKQRPPGRIDPLPEITEVETHTYSSSDLRNPFAPERVQETETTVTQSSGLTPDFNRRKEELEQFPLDALRMVGTLQKGGVFLGLIRTNEGTIHTVGVEPKDPEARKKKSFGTYMGMNHGKIDRITEDKIELTEIIKDGQGGYTERQATVALGGE